MQVDNPLNFAYQPNFEDFFNLDLLSGPSGASSSRSSSQSPSDSFSPLPPTPPNPFIVPDVSTNGYINFLDDEFNVSKVDPLAPPPSTGAPFDFFGVFEPSSGSQSSPESGRGSGTSPYSVESPVGIDPSLVGTPASAKPMSDFDEEEHPDDDNDDQDDSELGAESPLNEDDIIAPVKVGGRGKASRKGTVHSGGVVKKSGGNSGSAREKKENQPTAMLSTTSNDPDDWRPTPEEYKKMSSKEKRQLRNKISARNFRVRRKEYISTLEGDIAERDRLIDHIRTELLGTKSENVALRQEIDALKKALLDGRGLPTTPVLPPPAPLPTASASATLSSPKQVPATPKSPLLTPNTHKDLPTSPRLGSRSFWGGAANGMGGFGITPVHTTLVPEWGNVLSGKPVPSHAEKRLPNLQENINPILNNVTATSLASMGTGANQKKDAPLPLNAFDSFADRNMFTLKSMEDFRMQLWTRMGQQQAQNRQHQPAPVLNGLASSMRPAYFSKQSPTLSALLSGKSAASSYPTPPPSPPTTHASIPSTRQPTPTEQQHAMLASIASQTLVRKLGSAFWDAFSGSSSTSPASAHGLPRKDLDADKVRRVLEGKAVVRVVDVESTPTPTARTAPVTPSAKVQPAPSKKDCHPCSLSGMFSLEDGLKNMRL
ncbi:hypothetical protein C8Q75DRAFT_736516 [Abortiporus biennis]|nr:hypothetical protein C8Q75DRAFT_736516 [Abortiporus biennis]